MRDYTPDDDGLYGGASKWRFGAFTGVLFGALFGGVTWFVVPADAVKAGVMGGALFGVLWPVLFFRKMRDMQRRAQKGEGAFATNAPEGFPAELRAAASYKRTAWLAVGGALFVARGRAVFVPHALNLPTDRSPVAVPVSGATTVELVDQPATFLQKLLIPDMPQAVRISTGSESFDFVVASPRKAAEEIRAALRGG